MKIALIGYGKMGKEIEKIAIERGHKIIYRIDKNSESIDYQEVDVAVEFTTPSAAFQNISQCLQNGLPVISGTTGWLADYQQAVDLCNQKKGAFLYASNFSIGVNVFFEINKKLANLIKKFPQYEISIDEIHHTEKLDKPSGTALSLKKDIEAEFSQIHQQKNIPIESFRESNVAGNHIVSYQSNEDLIQMKHQAHSRKGFAFGAVLAAEWILGKQGVFSMRDVIFGN